MRMKRSFLVLLFSFSLFVAFGAHAQTFVCGQSMVQTGEGTTKEQVRETCGPPSVDEGDRWYYKNQPGQVTVVLVFQNGMLEQIQHIQQQ